MSVVLELGVTEQHINEVLDVLKTKFNNCTLYPESLCLLVQLLGTLNWLKKTSTI